MRLGLTTNHHDLPDTKQTFWQLAAIQLTSVTSLPVLVISVAIIQKTSLLNAILVLAISNLILWIVRYGLISMSFEGRKSTIDISREYLGKVWGLGEKSIFFVAALLLVSTAALFSEETALVCKAITSLISFNEGPNIDAFMQISVIFGIVSTVFCVSGMVALRWLSTVSLPIIIVSFIAMLFMTPNGVSFSEHTSLSLEGLSLMLGINLAITADLPTFFRHSESKTASIHALTTIQIVSFLMGIGGCFLGALLTPWVSGGSGGVVQPLTPVLTVLFVTLIALSAICANVSNVYSASVGWEVMAPKALVGKKEYLILGLLLTTFFISVVDVIPLEGLVQICDVAMMNLCIILALGFVVTLSTKSSPKTLEKSVYFFSWIVALVVNSFQIFGRFFSTVPTVVVSLAIYLPILCLLCLFRFATRSVRT